jgi:predicted aspartyl protease
MRGMGHFNVRGRLTGPTGRSEDVDLFVDTGSTLLVLPRPLADRLELVTQRMQSLRIAGDERVVWPVAEVRLHLEDQEAPTLCLIAPGGPAVLGMVALETLLLGVDPVHQRLVPIEPLA